MISRASAKKGTAGVRQARWPQGRGGFKETTSGADDGRPERAKVLALARARKIDAVLVTELSRWGRSTQDLVQTLDDLHGLHYIWLRALASWPAAVMRGGGCGGRLRFSCQRRAAASETAAPAS